MRASIFALLFAVSFFSCTPASGPDGGAGGGFVFGGGTATGGGTGATGGGTGADAGPTLPPTMTVCTGTSVPPPDVGSGCAAGSNQPLCVMQGSTDCESVCIWDSAAPSTPRAYCSMPCEQDADCPGGYECEPQNCSTGPAKVCVRRAVTGCTAVPAFGTSGRVLMRAPLKSVNAYVVGYLDNNVVTVRLMQGLTEVRTLGDFAFGGFADTVLETADDRVWWHVPPLVVRIDATSIETFTPSNDLSFYDFASLTSDGDVLAAYSRSMGTGALLRVDGGTLEPTPANIALYQYATRLDDGTLLGQCADGGVVDTCVTRDLVNTELLAYPADAGIDAPPSFAGSSLENLTMATAEGRVFRRVGGQWVEDVLVAGATGAGVREVGDALYVSLNGDGGIAYFIADEVCWKPVQVGVNGITGSALPGSLYGYYSSTRSWCQQIQPR